MQTTNDNIYREQVPAKEKLLKSKSGIQKGR
jgi:hypothetical protein